jgi:glucose-1-phosphate cytidylyltransferase
MQVVILCGGKGTRSYPFTDLVPKVMMPIGGRPILTHLMHIYARQGFTDFVLAAGHRQEILRDYFEGRYPNWQVNILDTGTNSDTAERIARCAPYLNGPFLATYGDGLSDLNLNELIACHRKCGGLATVTAVPLRSQYGTIEFDCAKRVNQFREKPLIRDSWINAGFFVFENAVFDHWEGRNLEVDILPNLAAKNELYTFLHEGFWKSMDTSKDQQELDRLIQEGDAPWMEGRKAVTVGPPGKAPQNGWTHQ